MQIILKDDKWYLTESTDAEKHALINYAVNSIAAEFGEDLGRDIVQRALAYTQQQQAQTLSPKSNADMKGTWFMSKGGIC